jgi:hypothetical protein
MQPANALGSSAIQAKHARVALNTLPELTLDSRLGEQTMARFARQFGIFAPT